MQLHINPREGVPIYRQIVNQVKYLVGSGRLAADAGLCEARLLAALEGRADQPVTQAMRYALRGGKRLRGFLVLEGARMLGVPEARTVQVPSQFDYPNQALLYVPQHLPDPRNAAFTGFAVEEILRLGEASFAHPLVRRLFAWRELMEAREYGRLFSRVLADSGVLRRERVGGIADLLQELRDHVGRPRDLRLLAGELLAQQPRAEVILRVDDDPRDVLRFVEPHLLPRLAGVGRAVNTVAVVRHDAADGVFAHTDIDDVRVALGDGDGTDRTRLEEAVRDISPADAHILGLPEPAAGRSHVISLRVADDAGAGI